MSKSPLSLISTKLSPSYTYLWLSGKPDSFLGGAVGLGAVPIHHCQAPSVADIKPWWPKSSPSQPPGPCLGSACRFPSYLAYQIFVLLLKAESEAGWWHPEAVKVVKEYI